VVFATVGVVDCDLRVQNWTPSPASREPAVPARTNATERIRMVFMRVGGFWLDRRAAECSPDNEE
jgi:hypothetical protein